MLKSKNADEKKRGIKPLALANNDNFKSEGEPLLNTKRVPAVSR